MKKKLLSLLLAFSMVLSLTGTTSMAGEPATEELEAQTTQQQEVEVTPEQEKPQQEIIPEVISEEVLQSDAPDENVIRTAAAVTGIKIYTEPTKKIYPYASVGASENTCFYTLANGSSVRLQYADGTEGNYTYSYQYPDKGYHAYIKNKATGEKLPFNNYIVAVGSYELYLTYETFEVKLSDITVVYPEDCYDKEITISSPVTYPSSSSQITVTKFTAPEEGRYKVTSKAKDTINKLYWYMRDANGQTVFSNVVDSNPGTTGRGRLKAGESYYLYCQTSTEYTLSIEKEDLAVIDIQKTKDPVRTSFPESSILNAIDNLIYTVARGASVQFKYSDGTMGNSIPNYQFLTEKMKVQLVNKETGTNVDIAYAGSSSSYLSRGFYELYLSFENIKMKLTDFAIKSAEECVDKEMTEFKPAAYTGLEGTTDTVTKFVAPETMVYQFKRQSEQSDFSFRICENDGTCLVTNYHSDTKTYADTISYKLEAGKAYYIYASPYKDTIFSVEKFSATVTSITASGTPNLGTDVPLTWAVRTSGSMGILASGITVTLTFDDGSTLIREVSDLEQFDVSLQLKDSMGNEIQLERAEPYHNLPMGSYQIYAKKDAVETKLMDFTVKAPADMVNQTLVAGGTVNYATANPQYTVTQFTVTEAGLYSIEEKDNNQLAGPYFTMVTNKGEYVNNRNMSDMDKPGTTYTYLQPGNYYFVKVSYSGDFSLSAKKIDVSKMEASIKNTSKELVFVSSTLGKLNNVPAKIFPSVKFTFADDTTKNFELDDLSSMNYQPRYGVRTVSGDSVNDSTAPAGTYEYLFWLGKTEQ